MPSLALSCSELFLETHVLHHLSSAYTSPFSVLPKFLGLSFNSSHTCFFFSIQNSFNIHPFQHSPARLDGEMAQYLKALAVFPEDPHHGLQQAPQFQSLWTLHAMWFICTLNTHTLEINNISIVKVLLSQYFLLCNNSWFTSEVPC